MPTARSSPTVIIARTVHGDRVDAFVEWIARLVNAASRYPGYVDSFVQPPTAAHPNEWTVVYRFVDGPALERWLGSDERSDLLSEGEGLVDGDPREQILAGVQEDDEARIVSSYRLQPGTEGEHLMVHKRILDALERFPGFLNRELLDAVDDVQPETVVVLTFDSATNLHAWLESDERRDAIEDLDRITVGDLTTNVVGGFAGWFPSHPGSEPKKWKQALVVLAALFPVSLSVTWIRIQMWPDLPLAPSVLIANIVGIAILTWLLMPPMTRALSGWLRS